jgi:hypothetical protein
VRVHLRQHHASPSLQKNPAVSTKPHDLFSRCLYINLESRLPHDTSSLEGVARCAGADTHLKLIASQKVMNIPPHNNGDNSDEGEESDGNASVSLEERPGYPHYSSLAHYIVSDDDTEEENLNDVPAHVVNEGTEADSKLKGMTPSSSGRKDDMEQKLFIQQQQIDNLTAQVGQLVELFKNVAGAMPNRTVQFTDPQYDEVENDANLHKTGEIPDIDVFPKKHETPPLNTLKDYHDIINDLVDKKMKQLSIDQNPQPSESKLDKPYASWHDLVSFPLGWPQQNSICSMVLVMQENTWHTLKPYSIPLITTILRVIDRVNLSLV